MTSREASLRVTLQPASFQAGLRRMTSMTTSAGRMMGQALKQPMSAGLKSAKAEFTNMVGGFKSAIKTVATLGGAVSFGALVKDAVAMQNTYRDIAFNVNKVAGNAESWQSIQEMVQASVHRTGRSAEDLTEAFMTVFEATGSLEYAKKAMDIVGTSATATGHSINSLATTMQLASRKFNVGADQAEEAMARMIEKTGVGGKGIEELTNRFALVAGEAANAGMQGAEGISELLGMLLLLDSSIGEKADPGLKMMFQTIKSGSSGFVRLKKEMGRGVEFRADMTAMEKIKATLSSAKGRKAAEMIFTADARVVYDELAKPFDKAMEEAKSKGMKKSEALKLALEAFDANLRTASESTMKFSSLQDEAATRMKEDPSVKFNMAVERMKEAFMQPKMIAAIDKLADKLPALADTLADVVSYIVDNPWESLAMIVGGKLALAFGGSFVQSAVANGVKSLFMRAAAVQAASTAASVATGGASTLGVGGAIGATGAAGGTAAGLGAAAGAGAAVLAAGAVGAGIGYGIYKYGGVEAGQTGEFKARQGAEEALMTATTALNSRNEAKMSEAILALAQARQTLKTSESLTNTIVGTLSSWATGGEVKSPAEVRESKSKEIAAEEEKLRKALATLRSNAEHTANSLRKVGTSADTARGPMVPSDPFPGAQPVGG